MEAAKFLHVAWNCVVATTRPLIVFGFAGLEFALNEQEDTVGLGAVELDLVGLVATFLGAAATGAFFGAAATGAFLGAVATGAFLGAAATGAFFGAATTGAFFGT